jgi:hypothetical protein
VIYKIIKEDNITTLEYTQIHNLLRLCYKDSKSFIDKIYADTRPDYRVLVYCENDLIGHHATFLNVISVNKISLPGIGLYCIKPHKNIRTVAYSMYKFLLDENSKLGFPISLAISNNATVLKISRKFFSAKIYNIKIKSKIRYAKPDDMLILVSSKPEEMNSASSKYIISYMQGLDCVFLKKGLF